MNSSKTIRLEARLKGSDEIVASTEYEAPYAPAREYALTNWRHQICFDNSDAHEYTMLVDGIPYGNLMEGRIDSDVREECERVLFVLADHVGTTTYMLAYYAGYGVSRRGHVLSLLSVLEWRGTVRKEEDARGNYRWFLV